MCTTTRLRCETKAAACPGPAPAVAPTEVNEIEPAGRGTSGSSVEVLAPILTRPFVSLLIVVCGCLLGFTLLLPVVPLYTAATGAGEVAAGLSTGALMLATVLTELAVPRLLATFGYRVVMTSGVLLLGVPAALLATSRSVPLILAVSVLRGTGLGIVVVIGTALAARLVPAQRRNEGLGIYGFVVGLPWILGLPVGLWVVDVVGFGWLFLAAAVLSLTGLVAVPGLRVQAGEVKHQGGMLAVLLVGGVRRPVLIFTAITVAAGVFLTFVPLAVPSGAHRLAAGALLAQACAGPLARWVAGRAGDRQGSPRPLLTPAVLVAAIGAAVASWVGSPFAVVAGMGLFGVGFGMAQNVTLALMLKHVGRSEFGRVSALWNVAYDAGMGIGAVGFGLLVGPAGYALGFALTAGVIWLAVGTARRDGHLDPGHSALRQLSASAREDQP